MFNKILPASFGTLIIIVMGCNSGNNIRLEKVSATSDHIQCHKVFAQSRDSIIQLNQIMIQTGLVDTTDERPPFKASVVHINGAELILNQTSTNKTGDTYHETYEGKSYQLQLNYKAAKLNNARIYTGECEISQGKQHTRLDIEGIDNNL